MNIFLVLSLLVAVYVSEGYSSSAHLRNKRQTFPREFQNINIDDYLKNENAVKFQIKCVVYDGPCDKIGKSLKMLIPDLLEQQCVTCDTSERDKASKLLTHIQGNYPADWEKSVKKFVPGGLVKPEDAARLESNLGVKLDPKFIDTHRRPAAPASSTPATSVSSTSQTPMRSSSISPVETTSHAADVSKDTSSVPSTPALIITESSSTSSSSSTAGLILLCSFIHLKYVLTN